MLIFLPLFFLGFFYFRGLLNCSLQLTLSMSVRRIKNVLAYAHQTTFHLKASVDSQPSDADDENPTSVNSGLTPVLPGQTVHAHVSDKPTDNRPAVSGPSINAALQVQMEAHKQHQKRLKALKFKLKKLREKLEQLQSSSNKQNTISGGLDKDTTNSAEIDTLNDLKKATQDAIKELHADYPHLKKHQSSKEI